MAIKEMKNRVRWQYVLFAFVVAAAVFLCSFLLWPDWGLSSRGLLSLAALAINIAISLFGGLPNFLRIHSIASSPPKSLQDLRAQCTTQRKFRIADLVGPGRRFDLKLYVLRQSAYDVFDRFKQSTSACLAIIGESGVGKSNLLVALSQMENADSQSMFYEGVHLRAGFVAALKEDLPWAFEANNSVADAGKIINDQFQKYRQRLCIFIDALDDIPTQYLSLIHI